MKKLVKFGLALLMASFFVACDDNEEEVEAITPISSGTLSGGPYTFLVGDGIVDNVSGVSLTGNTGDNSSFILTNAENEILGLPVDIAALQSENFDGAPPGICYIWYISYNDDLSGLVAGNTTDDISGTFEISNRLTINRNLATVGGTLTGGPFNFDVGDGVVDNVSGITLAGNAGENSVFLVTNTNGLILGMPPTLEALEGVDFDGVAGGVCLIWHLSYANGLQGLELQSNVDDLSGAEFSLSNSLIINRNFVISGGTLAGGPYTFDVGDGEVDNVTTITLEGNFGTNSKFLVTDANGKILGMPPTLDELKGVDFDGAGGGVCLIWHLSFEDDIQGDVPDGNTAALTGTFSLSNAITINRNLAVAGGTLSGGPFTFDVGDGIVDNVSSITLSGNLGSNSGFLVTDAEGNILGLPPTISALEGVDFDGAGDGVCLIWHISYEDGLEGRVVGENTSNLTGAFSLSNAITVTRNIVVEGGTISGGPFTFNVTDGTADNVSGISLTGNLGTNSRYLVTDADGTILGMPPTLTALEGVNFDGAGDGVCSIWHLSYEDDLSGDVVGQNTSGLSGKFDLSNSITVTRNAVVIGGTLSGGPFTFTAGDGTVDNVSGLGLTGQRGTNSVFLVTDDKGEILGMPPTLSAVEGVNFDEVGVGVCLIWHLSYENNISGLSAGANANDLTGTFELSNSITVNRQ